MRESHASEIVIHDIDPDIFSLVLEFIYTGNVKMKADQVTQLLVLADRFVVSNLKERCEDALIKVQNELENIILIV